MVFDPYSFGIGRVGNKPEKTLACTLLGVGVPLEVFARAALGWLLLGKGAYVSR